MGRKVKPTPDEKMDGRCEKAIQRDLNMISLAWFDLFQNQKKPSRLKMIIWIKEFRFDEKQQKILNNLLKT